MPGPTSEDLQRYSRQTLFAGIGESGQRALRAASITLVGAGALGSHLAESLVRAGVGRLRILDRDFVEWSNLQRQTLFTEGDAETVQPKAIAAARRLQAVNGQVVIEAQVADLDADNAERLLGGSDLVLDGSDNFDVRYLINDLCVRDGIPWIYAAVVSSYGVVMPIMPHETACLRCVFVQPPAAGSVATCDTVGVIGPAVSVVAGLASAEALKILVGAQDRLARGLTWIDVWNNTYQHTPIEKPVPSCAACGIGRFEYLLASADSGSAVLCGREAVQIRPLRPLGVSLETLAERLRPLGAVRANPYVVRFTQGALEMTIFEDGRAIVNGTDDPATARSAYARYVGS